MDYEYPAVLDEEEEKKDKAEHPYPAAQPIAPDPANRAFPPAAPPVGAEPSSPSLAVAAQNTPAPKYSDYAPAAPHGWAKAGHVLAAINPTTNRIVNEEPAAKAKLAYENATKERNTQFDQGAELEKETQARTKEKSEAGLRGSESHQHEATARAAEQGTDLLPWYNDDTKRTEQVTRKQWGELTKERGREKSAQDISTGKNKTATDISTAKNKSAEEIALGKRESAERIATAHNLTQTEIARIRAASASDPNKLTNTMKTMKQQAQATLPGIDRALDETEKVANLLGPGEGRWNDFWTNKVGMDNPTFKHYYDEIGMVQSAVTLAHARGRMSNELFEHFEKMFDAGKQSPENMIQALNVSHEWLSDYATMGDGPAGGAYPTTAPLPKVASGGAKTAPPKVGDVEKGHRFKGGDPHDKNNWEKVNAPGS